MKKITRLIVMLALVVAMAFGVIACSGDTINNNTNARTVKYKANAESTYYALTTMTSSHCGLAYATIATDADGKVSRRSFQELFIPNEWAKISYGDATLLGATFAAEADYTGTIDGNRAAQEAILGKYVIAVGGGSPSSAPSVTLYPNFIVIDMFDGTVHPTNNPTGSNPKVYAAKLLSSNTASSEAAWPTAFATNNKVEAGPLKGLAVRRGVVRYYPVAAAGVTSIDDISVSSNSFENSLNTQATAKAYHNMVTKLELTGSSNVDTSANIKYLKGSEGGKEGVLGATNFVGTERRAARDAYALTTTNTKVGLGAPMKDASGTDLSGANLAYATTFIKSDSDYDSRGGYWDYETNKKVSYGSDWEAFEAQMFAIIDHIGVENLSIADNTLAYKNSNNIWFVNVIDTTVTIGNMPEYLNIITKAYSGVVDSIEVAK